ncbi:GNAT family N-acetyltransferase [Alkalicoccus daliensis]|uniref:Protein N-acetyltransferase, RimJ/RimL family n=1 Tax=Alkalicoccus daliensis TaxID=745820 RepID=A0A1G9ZWT8_9BACI|nr:GNAT family N-acetyltransferase [Alkalicoccus daliensis]SDN25869.1 Protein N-acetyltransferase, RimJ/RimL family [Alkalicoccus daliensis]
MIREAALSDAGQFISLLHEIQRSGWIIQNVQDPLENEEKMKDYIMSYQRDKGSGIYLYIDNGTAVGYLIITISKNKMKRHCGLLEGGVQKNFRRKGIGDALLKEICHTAEDNNIKKLEVNVMSHNANALKVLYKNGFCKEGEKINSLQVNNRFINEIILGKWISPEKYSSSQ